VATKLELMAEQERFDRIGEAARIATTRFDYLNAINIAIGGLPHLIGKLQFEKRYSQNPMPALIALDVIFHFAPPNFLFHALDMVQRHFDDDSRIEKASDHDMRARLATARAAMDKAMMLWRQLEEGVPAYRVFDATERGILADWQHGNHVAKTDLGGVPRLTMALDLDATWLGKCECCGAKVKGTKVQFLVVKRCPGCRGLGRFVLIEPITR
jgi:hypothetical protein